MNNNEERIKRLRRSIESTKLGFAGLNKDGQKVDRREHPQAVPFAKNSMLNIPEPRCIKCEDEFPLDELVESVCAICSIDWYEKQYELLDFDAEERERVYVAHGVDRNGVKYVGTAHFVCGEFDRIENVDIK